MSAWMQDGHSYASLDAAGRMPAPVPMDITCDGKAGVCRTTVVGNVTQVFSNGKQICKMPPQPLLHPLFDMYAR